jgi:hypothetical protein
MRRRRHVGLARAILKSLIRASSHSGVKMTVRVVFDGPARPVLSRVGRSAAVLVGSLLLVTGMVALGLAAFVGPLLLPGLNGWSDEERPDAARVTAVCLLVAMVSLALAVRLLRGRRRLVLFLRRFGFADATSTVTFAAANVIGRSWRLVTLDDERVRALGGSAGPRRALGLILLLTMAALGLSGYWFLDNGPDRLFDWALARTSAETSTSDIGAGIGKALAAGIFAGFLLVVFIIVAAVTGVSSVFSLASYTAARRSERAKSALIRTERDVMSRSRKIERRSGRIFAPRLVVVRVADPVWQATVREFAARSDAVIVDVSIASENLLWEIRTLLPLLGSRCILVGRRDLLATTTADGRTIFNPTVARELDGRTVLGYGTSRHDVRRFARALEGFLAATAKVRA